MLQKTPATFDVSVWEFFLPLRVGARLVIATAGRPPRPAYLARVIAEQRSRRSLRAVDAGGVRGGVAGVADLASLRHVFVVGEALPAGDCGGVRAVTDAALHNLYGPTEAAVSITYRRRRRGRCGGGPDRAPGVEHAGVRAGRAAAPVPVGVPGELYLAGVQLARGYYGRAGPDGGPVRGESVRRAGERMYRTGDLVRWTRTGELEYIGRTDFQVKFRGQRIELGEIEAALLAHASVAQSVAVVVRDCDG